MNARELGLTQAKPSSIAEISERTGQRIDADNHRSNRGEVQTYTVSRDPLAAVWANELEPMLRREPRLKPTTLFEYLQEAYPSQYWPATPIPQKMGHRAVMIDVTADSYD